MRSVPRWAVLSAATAPVLLIGGWTLAAARQPPGYDPVTDTISALAADAATDRWIMTAALAGLGGCHLVTALGLRHHRSAGRLVLALGGVGTILVAAFPLPRAGASTAHTVAAGTAFVALSIWPALGARRGDQPHRDAGSLGPALTASATMLSLLGWFVWELNGGPRTGLAERIAAGTQALWPLCVVLSGRRATRTGSARRPG